MNKQAEKLTSGATLLTLNLWLLRGTGFCLTDVYREWEMVPRCVLPVKTSGVCKDLLVIPLASCGNLVEFQKAKSKQTGGGG